MLKLSDLSKQERKIIRAWCMYDWANSAFATSAITAILPVYFVFLFQDALGSELLIGGFSFTGSSLWSLGAALSTSIVAVTSPVLGVLGDRMAIRKTLLAIYMTAGSLFTVLAFFSAYTSSPWAWLLGTFFLGNIGFAGSLVFYNSLLPHVSPNDELLDDISSRGYAYGYLGGGLLLLVHLGLNLAFSGSSFADLVTRLSLASVGIWWFLWGLWTIKVVPEPPLLNANKAAPFSSAFKDSFSQLAKTFRELKNFKVMLLYFGAFLLFNDGIQTILAVAGAFAADTLGISLTFNMITILTIQFVAAFGAMLFSRIAKLTSTKKALTVSLVGWSFIVLLGVGIAPLEPSKLEDHDYQFVYVENTNIYKVDVAPDLSDSKLDKEWEQNIEGLIDVNTKTLSIDQAHSLHNLVAEKSQYSSMLSQGPLNVLNGASAIGPNHPSTLGSGTLDWWPIALRETVWKPLGIPADFQWLLLGIGVGLVMGGSQALARSLFAQIAPKSRSGEFFSFFGFLNRASYVFGPVLYALVTGILDTRTAVFSILVIIVAGAILLSRVNVEEGIRVAKEEDARMGL